MGPSDTVDILNKTATGTRTSPRKRPRPEDEDLPSSAHRAPEAKKRRSDIIKASSKSVSQLRTPVTRSRKSLEPSNDITLFPVVSPRATKSKDDRAEVTRKKTKTRNLQKKKIVEASPFKGQGEVVDVDMSKVDFNSYNTPAKKATKPRTNPLRVFDLHPIQQSARPVVVNEDENTIQTSTITSSRNPHSQNLARLHQDDHEASRAQVPMLQDIEMPTPEFSRISDMEEEDHYANQIQQQQQQEVPPVESDTEAVQTNRGNEMPLRNANQTQKPQERTEPKKQKKSKPRTEEQEHRREEERRKQKAAEQKKKAENAEASQEAALEQFEEWKEEFGRGIEKQAEEAGGLESWKVMGAGERTIVVNSLKAPETGTAPVNRPWTTPAKHVWQELRYLHRAFLRLHENGDYELEDEDAAQDAIEQLKGMSNIKYLRPEGDIGKPGVTTVLHLYDSIIPRLVQLLKVVLQSRYVDGLSTKAIQELSTLVGIGMELCTIAMEWTPKPSSLPAGTRRAVHNHVNPSLRTIRTYLLERQRHEEHFVKQQLIQMNLRLAQKKSRENKEKLWAEHKRRLASYPTHYPHSSQQPRHNDLEIVDIDEIDL